MTFFSQQRNNGTWERFVGSDGNSQSKIGRWRWFFLLFFFLKKTCKIENSVHSRKMIKYTRELSNIISTLFPRLWKLAHSYFYGNLKKAFYIFLLVLINFLFVPESFSFQVFLKIFFCCRAINFFCAIFFCFSSVGFYL